VDRQHARSLKGRHAAGNDTHKAVVEVTAVAAEPEPGRVWRPGGADRHRSSAHPTDPVGHSSRDRKDQARRPGRHGLGASLPPRCGRPLGVGFCAVLPMASPLSPSRFRLQAQGLSRSALKARDALVLQHLPLADAIASSAARRLFPLVEREDLIQVAREALVRSAARCRAGEPAEPYLRRCISGALQHHLRDRVRLVRVPHRLHAQGQCPLGHFSLDVPADGEHSLLDQLAAPSSDESLEAALGTEALEQLVDQLPAAQATALRLTVLEGLSLRAAAERLEISAMSVQRAQKKALAALRQQLVAGG
jgi:RNA polymerase sigma factor (sigma-70 family)